ncbi:beta strand repeat-containing protein, partial [Micromonospora sonneratiae]
MRSLVLQPDRRRMTARAAITVVGAVLAASLGPGTAQADPLPATYSGSTHGDAMSLNITAAGLTIGAALGHSATAVDSTADPRAHAESSNLEAGAIGIPVSVVTGDANSNNTTPTDSYNVALGQLDVPGLLDTGELVGTGSTNWAGDAACVPDGTAIAQSTTSMASANLGIPGITILDMGTLETSGQVTLSGGSVVSTSTGNLGSLSLINGLVAVNVATNPLLTATSDGTTGTVTANNYGVTVTVGGVTTTLTAGMSLPINLNIPFVATVNLTISVGNLVDASSGATGSGSLNFVSISGSATSLGVTLASFDFDLLPLSATATAPSGGVQCDALDPPTITSPTNGQTTGETPTISGTGIPGATVTVTESGTVIGTAVVAPDGTWSLVPATPLAVGDHTITATQESGGIVSGPSNSVTFTVQAPPAAPVITSPTNGQQVNDSTPTITGTGEPGNTITVTIDGVVAGTTTVAPDGTWSFDTPTALTDGPHTVTATQTDAAGNVSPPSDPVTFTVDTTAPAAPVITSPTNGQVVNDSTPTITGTGEPGNTITVTIDGVVAGTTT